MQRITDVTNHVKLCSIFSVLETCVLFAQKRRSQKEWQRWPGSKQLSWCSPPCFYIWIETKVALGSCFRVGRTCCRWTASSYFGPENGTYLGVLSQCHFNMCKAPRPCFIWPLEFACHGQAERAHSQVPGQVLLFTLRKMSSEVPKAAAKQTTKGDSPAKGVEQTGNKQFLTCRECVGQSEVWISFKKRRGKQGNRETHGLIQYINYWYLFIIYYYICVCVLPKNKWGGVLLGPQHRGVPQLWEGIPAQGVTVQMPSQGPSPARCHQAPWDLGMCGPVVWLGVVFLQDTTLLNCGTLITPVQILQGPIQANFIVGDLLQTDRGGWFDSGKHNCCKMTTGLASFLCFLF